LNQRPSGYEPDELPGCSTPHQKPLSADIFAAEGIRNIRKENRRVNKNNAVIATKSTKALYHSPYKQTNTTQLVPKAGLEPAQPYGHYPLKVACLPFHHFGKIYIKKHKPDAISYLCFPEGQAFQNDVTHRKAPQKNKRYNQDKEAGSTILYSQG
jgi:hypothetical protein